MILCVYVCMFGHNLFIISPNASPWSLAMYQKFTVSTVYYDSSFVTFTLVFAHPQYFSSFLFKRSFIQKEKKKSNPISCIQNIFPFDPTKNENHGKEHNFQHGPGPAGILDSLYVCDSILYKCYEIYNKNCEESCCALPNNFPRILPVLFFCISYNPDIIVSFTLGIYCSI